jgi:hypothetical protein
LTATVQGVPQATIHSRRLSALDMQVRARLADLFDRPAGSFVLYYRLHGHGGAHG